MGMINFFKKLAFVQAILGMVTYAVAERNPVLVLTGGTLGMMSWYIVEGPGGKPLPRWMINAGVIAATSWLFYSQLPGPGPHQPLIVGLGQFITCMVLFKLYEKKNNRDWAQLMVLSLMQMICSLIISSDALFGFMVMVYLFVTLVTVLLFQLKMSYEEVADANEKQTPPGQRPVQPLAIVTRGHTRQFNALSAVCGFGCLVIACLFFLLLPRGQGAGVLGDLGTHNRVQQSGGVSSEVNVRSSGLIRLSRVPVMNVSIIRDGHTLGPGDYPVTYFRGVGVDEYDVSKAKWVRSKKIEAQDRTVLDEVKEKDKGQPVPEVGGGKAARAELTTLPPRPPPTGRITQEFTIRTPTKGYIHTLPSPAAVESGEIKKIDFNPFDQTLETQQQGASGTTYIVESFAEAADLSEEYRKKWASGAPFDWKGYARGPASRDPRVSTEAGAIIAVQSLAREPEVESTPQDHQIAAVIEAYLQDKRFRYTLDLPEIPATADPIAAFIFDNRAGHCELFASAMCAMVRSLGLRARIVNGFRAAEYNELGNYYVLRQLNAHSWVEVWQDGVGWKAFDPSPPGTVGLLHQPSGGWLLGPLRDLYEYVEFKWLDKVIAYDPEQQRNVMVSINHNLDMVTERLTKLKEMIGGFLASISEKWQLGRFGYIVLFFVMTVIAAFISVAVFFLVQRRRAIRQLQLESVSRRVARRLARHLEFYLNMLRFLEKAGFVKPVWQTPAGFAEQLQLQNAVRFAPVVPLTEIFYEIRFGDRPLDAERSRLISQHLETLKQTV